MYLKWRNKVLGKKVQRKLKEERNNRVNQNQPTLFTVYVRKKEDKLVHKRIRRIPLFNIVGLLITTLISQIKDK